MGLHTILEQIELFKKAEPFCPQEIDLHPINSYWRSLAYFQGCFTIKCYFAWLNQTFNDITKFQPPLVMLHVIMSNNVDMY